MPWVGAVRYLRVYFASSRKLKRSLDHDAKRSLHRSVNTVFFGKVGDRSTTAHVVLRLLAPPGDVRAGVGVASSHQRAGRCGGDRADRRGAVAGRVRAHLPHDAHHPELRARPVQEDQGYDAIRDASLARAQKPTRVGSVYRSEPTTKTEK